MAGGRRLSRAAAGLKQVRSSTARHGGNLRSLFSEEMADMRCKVRVLTEVRA